MSVVQVIEGTLKPDGTLELKGQLNLPPGPVQVTVQTQDVKPTQAPGWWEVLQQVWKEQDARGYKPPSDEEMEAQIAELRNDEEYEERWRQVWAQTEAPSPRKDNP